MATHKPTGIEAPDTKSRKSDVWQHFGFPVFEDKVADKTKTVCRHCKVIMPYNGNTTNMRTHLVRHHANLSSSSRGTDTGTKPKEFETCVKTENEYETTQQRKLTSMFEKQQRYPSAFSKSVDISNAVAKFIVSDMRPLSIVDNAEFKILLQKLDPRYLLPSRRHFSDKIIPEMYEQKKTEISEKIHRAMSISLTTDSWTSRACQSYVTVTVHFTGPDWTIQNCVLTTRMMSVSHTGENIASSLNEILQEWSLDNYRPLGIALTTDNASNMEIAARVGKFVPRIKCFAHTLNLASQKALKVPCMAKLLAKTKRIVTFFHKSTTATAVLKSKQTLLKVPQHKLITDVATRWNSSFEMLSRFLEQQSAILSALTSSELKKNVKDIVTLSDSDINNAEKAVEVLRPLKMATTIMCDQHFPTVSMIFPLRAQILESMVETADDCKLVKEVKEAIRADLAPLYQSEEIEDFLLILSALDPRFHSLPHVDDLKRQQVYDLIERRAATLHVHEVEKAQAKMEKEDDAPSQPVLPEVPQLPQLVLPELPEQPSYEAVERLQNPNDDGCQQPVKKKPKGAMEDLFGDVFVVSQTPGKLTSDLVHEEVLKYKAEPNIPLSGNPMQWWKNNSCNYPKLAIVAKSFLSIPGTSVPSERVFSCTGDIVTATRSCLDPDLVDKLIFLKMNFHS